jgi:eukaryotic translation initiation factor 2C
MKSKIYSGGKTLIIGADVSHAAPGVNDQGSMACLTFSQDQTFTRYAAAVETNGDRQEIIMKSTMRSLIDKQIRTWFSHHHGRVPDKILYFRDGVSNEQYRQVISQEVRDIKEFFSDNFGGVQVNMAVVVATKRHHIRFFPEKGDRNGNPLPGTIVEQGCTDPNDFDWYCCSHVAIKGTARPVHYYCLMDEIGLEHEALQQFIFEHSFQYMRSTTPVSIFPAIYYAHLASNRGKCHEQKAAVRSGKKEAAERIADGEDPDKVAGEMYDKRQKEQRGSTSDGKPLEFPPLMPMPDTNRINDTMWYI